jgi:hypothetical protein
LGFCCRPSGVLLSRLKHRYRALARPAWCYRPCRDFPLGFCCRDIGTGRWHARHGAIVPIGTSHWGFAVATETSIPGVVTPGKVLPSLSGLPTGGFAVAIETSIPGVVTPGTVLSSLSGLPNGVLLSRLKHQYRALARPAKCYRPCRDFTLGFCCRD